MPYGRQFKKGMKNLGKNLNRAKLEPDTTAEREELIAKSKPEVGDQVKKTSDKLSSGFERLKNAINDKKGKLYNGNNIKDEFVIEDDMKGMSVKSGHKRPTKSGAGMTAKGVAAYRRRNPGSKLKTAVTGKVKKGSKDAKRRKSYCARSAGQMKKFPKAAKDPNSRLRQARRRWKC